MSQFPDDDHELVNFLRQHRSPVPPPSPAAEDRLIAAINALPQSDTVVEFRRSRRERRSTIWLIPPAIAAGLVATLIGYRALVPAKPSNADLASLEAFVESNWQSTVNNTNSDDEAPLFGDVATN